MPMKRFRVAGHSMAPALQPGQEVVTTDTRTPVPGNVVAFEHPGQPGFWLIKRLTDEAGWVLSDNLADGRDDSRTLGPIDPDRLLPVVTQLDEETFAQACHLLGEEEQAIHGIIEQWGIPEFWHRSPGFPTLVLLILEQQVSLESGAAMYRRLRDLVGVVTPETVERAGPDALRSIGVTRQKTGYLLGLANAVTSGDLDLEELSSLPDDQARAELTALRGIGNWTADAYLLSAERRPDMWPVGDRALQVGAAEALGMNSIPDESELEIVGEPWRPIRAAAARLIWHAYLSERGRVEPPDPTLVHGVGDGA